MTQSYRSPTSSLRLPMPGSPSSSWALYRARISQLFNGFDTSVLIAFWLFGLINNVLYVIVLSAALDLVGPTVPKGVVLLADVLPSFFTKLMCPYFIHKIPYSIRILFFVSLSTLGMLLVALTPETQTGGSITVKLFGVGLASISSGAGELSFLGLTHFYGHMGLAAWGSGTGGAGLIGAGLYVLLTTWIGFSVKNSLLTSALLPSIMLISFFFILPHGPLKHSETRKQYTDIPSEEPSPNVDSDDDDANIFGSDPLSASAVYAVPRSNFEENIRRIKALFIPYMLPLLLVYIAEYTINQGVSPTLLFPLPSTPFSTYRSFYPVYNFLYQVGVFIARSSTPWFRVHNLYAPSLLQVLNLALLSSHALFNWIPSVWLVFAIVFWEGLLGGAVYVNTFAEIMEHVDTRDREFSLGATSVSDSAGICIAGFVGMALEVGLCNWQVARGRDYCRQL